MKKYRKSNGQFSRDQRLTNWFVALIGFGFVGVILGAYIRDGVYHVLNSIGAGVQIESAQASVEYGTWQQQVDQILTDYKINKQIAYAVIQCESGWNPQAVNTKNKDGTDDKGLWMINSIHDVPDDVRLDPVQSTYVAIQLINSPQGWHHWVAYGGKCYQNALHAQS